MKQRDPGKQNRAVTVLLVVLCLLLCLLSVLLLLRLLSVSKNEPSDLSDLHPGTWKETESRETFDPEIKGNETETDSGADGTETEEEWYVATFEDLSETLEAEETETYEGLMEVSLSGYQELNEDVYAYLYIPDTAISYPVLQHPTDDDYYLNHNIDGTLKPGSVYSESRNSKDFTDPMTILYAHNMTSGVLFHDLEKFYGADFFNEHPDVFVYLPDKVLVYRIFASYVYDDRHLMYYFHDFERRSIRERYIKEIFLHNNRRDHYRMTEAHKVTTDSHILTLSTCVNELSENRYLVQAYPRYVIYRDNR